MAQATLMSDQIESGAKFVRLLDASIPVKAAFWVQSENLRPWSLYVAADKINDSNLRDAYGEVFRIFRENDDLTIDPFLIHLIAADEPMARDVLKLRGTGRGTPRHYFGPFLGREYIEEAYIYPLPHNASVH